MWIIFNTAIAGLDFSYRKDQLVFVQDAAQAQKWIDSGVAGIALDEDVNEWPPSQRRVMTNNFGEGWGTFHETIVTE